MLGKLVSPVPMLNALHGGLPVDYPDLPMPGGRMTLTQGTAVTTANVTAAGTLYYEPLIHNKIPIFDGERVRLYSFPASKVALALTLTTLKVYDVFAYWRDGLQLGLSAAWTNATTRADALTTLAGTVDGFKVNSLAYPGFGPKMGTHLGRIYASGTSQCTDSLLIRGVSNRYNQIRRKLYACPGYTDDNAATSYSHTSTTFSQANAGTGSTIKFLADGISPVETVLTAAFITPNSANAQIQMGISVPDSITSAQCVIIGNSTLSLAYTLSMGTAWPFEALAEGYHAVDILAYVSAGTATIYADGPRLGSAADPPATFLNGIVMG